MVKIIFMPHLGHWKGYQVCDRRMCCSVSTPAWWFHSCSSVQ